jgi:hypothetical protein
LLEGRVVEFDMRRNNARVIEHGFSAFGQERRPGRAELAGLVGDDHELEYEFVVSVHRNTTTTSPGEFRIRLEPKAGDAAGAILVPTPPNPGLTFKPDELAITIKNKGPTAGLVLRRPASDALTTERQNHSIAIAGNIPAAANSERNNDKALLESDVMLPPLFRDPDLVPAPGNRIVYRGMRLSNDRFEDVKRQQFEEGVLFAPYRFFRHPSGDPLSLQEAKDMMLAEFEGKIAADPDIFSPLFDPDFDIMPQDQILAVAHTQHTAPDFPNPDFSPFISTAEHIEVAVNFALDKQNDVRLLLAIEVPEDQGIRFVETATPALAGRNLQRRVNEEEGLEIIYLDDLPFIRCHVYHVIPNGAVDSNGPWELRYFRSYGPPFFGTP